MEQQHLESLLADQALGELSAPASWLLDRYLREHPECRGQADEVRRTIELARAALLVAQPAEIPLPAMPFLRFRPWGAWMRTVAWSAACAACLLLGWLLAPPLPPKGPAANRAMPTLDHDLPGSADRLPVALAAETADDRPFWSVRSWVERSSRLSKIAGSSSGIVWKAPFEVAAN